MILIIQVASRVHRDPGCEHPGRVTSRALGEPGRRVYAYIECVFWGARRPESTARARLSPSEAYLRIWGSDGPKAGSVIIQRVCANRRFKTRLPRDPLDPIQEDCPCLTLLLAILTQYYSSAEAL